VLLNGIVDPDESCHFHTETSSYKIDIHFPVDYPDQQALIDATT
jgi:hypothetical protein